LQKKIERKKLKGEEFKKKLKMIPNKINSNYKNYDQI
jgi:hypothetical protein